MKTQVKNNRRNKKKKHLNEIISRILFLIVGAIFAWLLTSLLDTRGFNMFKNTTPILDISHEENVIELYDKYGGSIRRIKVDNKITDAFHFKDAKRIIIGTDIGGKNPGYIKYLNLKGEVSYSFNTYDEKYLKSYEEKHSNYFQIMQMRCAYIVGDEKKYIIAIAPDPIYTPTRIVILNASNNLKGDYWHYGSIYKMELADLNADDTLELILAGVNNCLNDSFGIQPPPYIYIACVLSLKDLKKQSIPGKFSGLDMTHGMWYFIFGQDSSELDIGIEDRNGDGLNDVRISTRDGKFYYIDYNGEVIETIASDRWKKNNPGCKVPQPKRVVVSNNIFTIDSLY